MIIKSAKMLGDLVRYHRKQAGLTQEGLARLAGVGKTVIFDVEKGKDTVKLKTLTNIFTVLNIKMDLQGPFAAKQERL